MKKITLISIIVTSAYCFTTNSFGQTYFSTLFTGLGSTAILKEPRGVCVDKKGNIYFSDSKNYQIKKIKSNGSIEVYAGSGIGGSTDGAGNLARFLDPCAITIDSIGNIYVADASNHSIRKIDTLKNVSTIAKSTANLTFSSPQSICLDNKNNLFVIDYNSGNLRKITPSGVVMNVVDKLNQNVTFGSFAATSMAIDSVGNLFIATGRRISKFSTDSVLSVYAGGTSGDLDGPRLSAKLNSVYGIAVDKKGNIYFGDAFKFKRIDNLGNVKTIAGSGTTNVGIDGEGLLNQFGRAVAVAFDSIGNPIIADQNFHSIRKFDLATNFLQTIAISSTSTSILAGPNSVSRYSVMTDFVMDNDGNMYLSEQNAIRKIDKSGYSTIFAGALGFGNTDGLPNIARFQNIQGICIDKIGNLYVADAGNHRIRKITPSGLVSTVAGSSSGLVNATGISARFNNPIDVVIDSKGNLFVADNGNKRIRKINPNGVVTTFAGNNGSTPIDDIGESASFNSTYKMTIDSKDNIYLINYNTSNSVIRKISATAAVSTILGGPNGYAEGIGKSSKFNFGTKSGISIDNDQNLFIADNVNNRIRKVNLTTLQTETIAGDGTLGYLEGKNSILKNPSSTWANTLGEVYFLDEGNRYVRKLTPDGGIVTYSDIETNQISIESVLYPNPTSDKLFVSGKSTNTLYTILNSLGMEVKKGFTSGNSIDVSQLDNGVYYIQLSENETNQRLKFIKQ